MTVLVYRITLDEPTLFTTLAGDPNSLVSHDYIPGSVLRGMLIGAMLRGQGRDFSLDAGHIEDRRLFFSGATRYLNAYPVIHEKRSLPVPASWQTYKYLSADEEDSVNYPVFDSALRNAEAERKTTSISGFALLNNQTMYRLNPRRSINVHSQRGRYTRRQREDANIVTQEVFRYDALAANQMFEGAILCDNEDDAGVLAKLLQELNQLSIGGARSAGYGLVHILFDSNTDIYENHVWQEADMQTDTSPLLLTLLSDTIIRHSDGNHIPRPDAMEAILKACGIECQLKPVTTRTTMVGGFNRKWGLPLPQVPAFAAGSVFEIMNLKASEQAFNDLLWYGIGERIVDGYGRVTVGWQQQPELDATDYSQQIASSTDSAELSDLSEDIWFGKKAQSGLIDRLTTQTLERRLTGIVYSRKYTIHGYVTRTQLARLRATIANELRKENPSRHALEQFVNDVRGKYAGRMLDDAAIAGQRLSSWLANPDFGDDIPSDIQTRDDYLLRLVDAALERAHKEKMQQGG